MEKCQASGDNKRFVRLISNEYDTFPKPLLPMAASSILITAADAAFFHLVRGTIDSIRDKPEGRRANVGFFDLGCTPEQLAWLNEHVNFIRKPEWEFDFPGRDQAKEGLKGFLARVYLQKYFPGFDVYFWIDA